MRNTATWIALGLMALALALRLHGIDWGLPQIYEEAYPLKKSWPMWGWGSAQSFTLDPKFFNYPSFYMYVQLLGQFVLYGILSVIGRIGNSIDFQLLYTIDPTPFYLMGRSITTLFAVATVGLTFAIGRRVAGLGVATMAAFWVAVNGFHIAKSQAIEVDVPLTMFVMLTGWFALQIPENPRLRNYLLAGIFAGLATSTKYSGGLLPVMILLAHLVAVARSSRRVAPAPRPAHAARTTSSRKGRGKSRRSTEPASPPPRAGIAWFGPLARPLWRNLALAAAVCVAALLLTSPYIVLDWDAFRIGFNYERTHMQEGHFGLGSSPAMAWYASVIVDRILGWPLAILALVGLVWVVVVQKRSWAAILAIFPLVYILILSSWQMKAARYILPVLPIACLMASVAIMQIFERLRRIPLRLRTAVAVVVTLLLALPALAEYKDVLRRSRGDTRTLSRQWILDNIPAGAFLVSEAYGPEPFHAIQFVDMEPELRKALQERYADVPVYGLLQIPMLQVRSQYVEPFYELDQYVSADYLITSSSVRGRYEREPQKYPNIIEFYKELDDTWERVKSFEHLDMVGPDIRIYKNPQQDTVLANRGMVRAPFSLPRIQDPGTGLVAPHLQRFGAILEVFGYQEAAAEAFELALTYPPISEELTQALVVRALRARMRAGQRDRALSLLDAALATAPSEQQRNVYQTLKDTYFSGGSSASAAADSSETGEGDR
jgi:4-amino-4-deoxy-L-arabinose transferase-like glycosyltransferase